MFKGLNGIISNNIVKVFYYDRVNDVDRDMLIDPDVTVTEEILENLYNNLDNTIDIKNVIGKNYGYSNLYENINGEIFNNTYTIDVKMLYGYYDVESVNSDTIVFNEVVNDLYRNLQKESLNNNYTLNSGVISFYNWWGSSSVNGSINSDIDVMCNTFNYNNIDDTYSMYNFFSYNAQSHYINNYDLTAKYNSVISTDDNSKLRFFSKSSSNESSQNIYNIHNNVIYINDLTITDVYHSNWDAQLSTYPVNYEIITDTYKNTNDIISTNCPIN